MGYKCIWKILNTQCNIRATQRTVMLALRATDSEGVRLRQYHRLRRRLYYSQGPNYILHMDGYDKLSPYGFPIHGAVDGYSRKILWLKVVPSNKNPRYVARLFLDHLLETFKLPRVLRSDAGTENVLVKKIQVALRQYHNDDMKGNKCYSIGRSTANQRIEMLWSILMRHFTCYWRNYFRDLIDQGIFNNNSNLHIQCLVFCFNGLIQNDLDTFRLYWNNHRIRSQRHVTVPSGIPNVLYSHHVLYGGRDCSFDVSFVKKDIKILKEHVTKDFPYRGCNDTFLELVEVLTGELPVDIAHPNNKEGLLLFQALIAAIESSVGEEQM